MQGHREELEVLWDRRKPGKNREEALEADNFDAYLEEIRLNGVWAPTWSACLSPQR